MLLFADDTLSGQKTFTVLSLHINNMFVKKRGIAKKLILTIRAVMLGGTCRPRCRRFQRDKRGGAAIETNISTIEEAFAD